MCDSDGETQHGAIPSRGITWLLLPSVQPPPAASAGGSRMMFMSPLQGDTCWNVTTGSSSGCRGCFPRAPHTPSLFLVWVRAAVAEQDCLSCAPKPWSGQDWTFVVKPCCQEGHLFWGNERITTQLLICHDPVLHGGDCDCRLELSYCAYVE